MERTALRWCGLVVLALILGLGPVAAWAQFDTLPVRPLKLAGYWDRDTNDPAVIGVLTISDQDGTIIRKLGVTRAQAFSPETEGMQIFQGNILQPVTLRLLGDPGTIATAMKASPQDRVTMLGQYTIGSGTLLIGSITVGDPQPSPSPP